MIGILTFAPRDIARYIGEAGIASHQVVFNPQGVETTVNVQVGGHGVYTTHCYVQHQGQKTRLIQCLDPRTVQASPINKVFILCALAKAKAIDEGAVPTADPSITIATTVETVERFLLSPGPRIAVDIECNVDTHELTCIGFAKKVDGELRALTIPFERSANGRALSYWSEMDEYKIWLIIANLLKRPVEKVFQNYIFDTMILSRLGLHTEGPILDTMTLAHLIQPELPKSLKDLGRLYLSCDVWKDVSSWESTDQLWKYNARDAAFTLEILEAQLQVSGEVKKAFFMTHQVPLHSEVLTMCERGWNIDVEELGRINAQLEPLIGSMLQELKSICNPLLVPKIEYIQRKGSLKGKRDRSYFRMDGDTYVPVEIPAEINMLKKMTFPVYEKVVQVQDYKPLSPLQVQEILNAFGIKIPTYQGREVTDIHAMNKILDSLYLKNGSEEAIAYVELQLKYRKKHKMWKTYGQVKLDSDGKLRFTILIAGSNNKGRDGKGGTKLSRFSCKQTPWRTGFNGQNVPKEFRTVSVPHHKDSVIVNVDFRQADPHMVAWMSGETTMQKILAENGDLHSHTANAIVGRDITLEPGYKDSKERKLGKEANNGLNYGMGINKFITTCRKRGIKLTIDEAKRAYDTYFALYPNIRVWQNDIKAKINKTRTLETPFGRTRYFYDHVDWKLYNNAFAYIAPTTVADALNQAWLRLVYLSKYHGIDMMVLMQCHDSLKLEVPKSRLAELIPLIREAFAEVKFQLNGQTRCLPIDIEWGKSWGTMEKIV